MIQIYLKVVEILFKSRVIINQIFSWWLTAVTLESSTETLRFFAIGDIGDESIVHCIKRY